MAILHSSPPCWWPHSCWWPPRSSPSGRSMPAAFTWHGGWGRGQGGALPGEGTNLRLRSQIATASCWSCATVDKSLNLSVPLLSPVQAPDEPLGATSLRAGRSSQHRPHSHCLSAHLEWRPLQLSPTFALSAGTWAAGETQTPTWWVCSPTPHYMQAPNNCRAGCNSVPTLGGSDGATTPSRGLGSTGHRSPWLCLALSSVLGSPRGMLGGALPAAHPLCAGQPRASSH